MESLNVLTALLRKELKQEARSKEFFGVLFSSAVSIAVITAFGARLATADNSQLLALFPALTWIAFFFSASLAISKSFDYELEEAGYEGLLIMQVSAAWVYLAKFLVHTGLLSLGFVLVATVIWIITDLGGALPPPAFFLLALPAIIGFVALSTLMVTLSASSQLRGSILPVIIFPLLLPLFFAALELSFQLVVNERFDISSVWFSLLVGLDVIYLLLGLNLYGHALRE